MRASLLHPKEREQFDAFVAGQKTGSVTQSYAFGLFREAAGLGKFWPIVVYDDGEIVGTALLIQRKIPFGQSWITCMGGPVLKNDHPQGGAILDALFLEMETIAQKEGAIFFRIEPRFLKNDGMFLSFLGRHSGRTAIFQNYPEHTLCIDLTLSEGEILAQMKPKGRYNIKVAERKGVIVRQGTKEDVTHFYSLLQETAKRDCFAIHPQSVYEQFLTHVPSAIFLAEYQGAVLGAILVTFFGREATYYYGASSSEHRETMAAYALHWAAILEAKKRGCAAYDFFGIAPEESAGHVWARLSQFKEKFGGRRVEYEKTQDYILKPLWFFAFRTMKRLLSIR